MFFNLLKKLVLFFFTNKKHNAEVYIFKNYVKVDGILYKYEDGEFIPVFLSKKNENLRKM